MKFHPDGTLPGDEGTIFVFGSNLAGRHGRGAAEIARARFGAVTGIGGGAMGECYAIPTKGLDLRRSLGITQIMAHVTTFLSYARAHPQLEFFVTRIGCGLAGYDDEDIAPMFRDAPPNCSFAEPWRRILERENDGRKETGTRR